MSAKEGLTSNKLYFKTCLRGTEKSTKLGQEDVRTAGNPECVGVGAMVGGVCYWLVIKMVI